MSENNKSHLRRLQPPWVASHDAAHRAGGGVAMLAIVHDDDSGNIATVDLAREGLLIDQSPFVGRGRCAVVNQQIHQMSGLAADGQEFAYTDMHKTLSARNSEIQCWSCEKLQRALHFGTAGLSEVSAFATR
jgi:hypothetical protein